MLSIDEAIAFERQQAKDKRNEHYTFGIQKSKEAAEEHEQLAKWLEELKDYRDKNKMVVRIDVENMDSIKDKIEEYAESQYNKAIDECNKKLDELERNYKSCYGTEIIEMYADVYEDFRAWLKEQNK